MIFIRTITLLLLLICTFYCNDIKGQSHFDTFLNTNYKGGNDAFLKLIYSTLKYPRQARQNCIQGKVYFSLHISETGKIDSIFHTSLLQSGVEESCLNAISHTDGNWINQKDTIFNLSFVFTLGQASIVKGDITVNAVPVKMDHTSDSRTNSCLSTSDLLSNLMELIRTEQFKKANRLIEKLIQRDPYSDHFLGLQKMILSKLQKK